MAVLRPGPCRKILLSFPCLLPGFCNVRQEGCQIRMCVFLKSYLQRLGLNGCPPAAEAVTARSLPDMPKTDGIHSGVDRGTPFCMGVTGNLVSSTGPNTDSPGGAATIRPNRRHTSRNILEVKGMRCLLWLWNVKTTDKYCQDMGFPFRNTGRQTGYMSQSCSASSTFDCGCMLRIRYNGGWFIPLTQ